jgi:RND superfamily putative drug exporter
MIPRFIRLFCIPILLGWLAVTVLVNVIAPQLEVVGEGHSVSLAPTDAPSMQAMQRVGRDFQEFDSNSSAMVVLESDQPLGDAAHKYYDGLIDKLEADKKHVQHVQDFWGDPLTAAGSQSADNKAAYVQLYLAGNQGESLANESVQAVRDIVASSTPPPGLKAYVTGPAPLTNDQHHAGDKSIKLITMITICVIFLMLLFVYRSIVTVLIVLVMMFIELAAARGIVATLGYYNIIGLSTFATNLLTTLAIAAATDYAIFLIGRYQEARSNGEDRESAFYTMYHGTAHVILGSGLTIAGATFCLHFTRLPLLPDDGDPTGRWHLGGHDRRSDDGPCSDDHPHPVRVARSQTRAANARMAEDRCRRCPVAGADPRGHHRSRAGRPARAAGLQAELQRPRVPACRHPGQPGLCGR